MFYSLDRCAERCISFLFVFLRFFLFPFLGVFFLKVRKKIEIKRKENAAVQKKALILGTKSWLHAK